MSGISNQSPAVLKNADGASKIGRGASTVDADLTTAEAAIAANAGAVVDLNSGMLARVNNKAMENAIVMTAATTGAGGIRIIPSSKFAVTTGNFALPWEGSIDAGTVPTDAHRLIGQYQDLDNRLQFSYTPSTKTFSVLAKKAGATIIDASVVLESALTLGRAYKIEPVVVRENAIADGSVAVYVDGNLVGTVAIAAAATVDISNTGNWHISGNTIASLYRLPSETISAMTINYAPSAAEVLHRVENGPNFSLIGASEVPVYESDFSAGVDGWGKLQGGTITGNVDGVNGQDNWLRITCNGAVDDGGFKNLSQSISAGKRGKFALRVYLDPANVTVTGVTVTLRTAAGASTGASEDYQVGVGNQLDIVLESEEPFADIVGQLRVIGSNSSGVRVNTSGDLIFVKVVEVTKTGVTGWWRADDCQGNTAQILDRSGNDNHALLPSSGAMVLLRPRRAAVISEHSWYGTGEAQYLSLFNQNVLPVDAYIERVIAIVTGDPQQGKLGDGIDDDRYCKLEENAGMIEGVNTLAINKRVSDGTNGKLLWTPLLSGTCTIKFIVEYLVMGV